MAAAAGAISIMHAGSSVHTKNLLPRRPIRDGKNNNVTNMAAAVALQANTPQPKGDEKVTCYLHHCGVLYDDVVLGVRSVISKVRNIKAMNHTHKPKATYSRRL
jgi:hypothetical protein